MEARGDSCGEEQRPARPDRFWRASGVGRRGMSVMGLPVIPDLDDDFREPKRDSSVFHDSEGGERFP